MFKTHIQRESKRQKFTSCVLPHGFCGHALFRAVFVSTAVCVHKRSVTIAERADDSIDTCALVPSAFGHALFSQWN